MHIYTCTSSVVFVSLGKHVCARLYVVCCFDIVHTDFCANSDRGLRTLLHSYTPPLRTVQARARNPSTSVVPDVKTDLHTFIRVVSAADIMDDSSYPFYVIYQSPSALPMQFNVRVQGIFVDGCLDMSGFNWPL